MGKEKKKERRRNNRPVVLYAPSRTPEAATCLQQRWPEDRQPLRAVFAGPRKPIGSLFRAWIGQKSGQVAPTDKLCFDSVVPGSLLDFPGSSGNTGQPEGEKVGIPSSVVLLAPAYSAMWMPASSCGPPIPGGIRYMIAGPPPILAGRTPAGRSKTR